MSKKDIECVECRYFVRCPVGYSHDSAVCLTIREPIKLSEYELKGLEERMDKALKLVKETLEKDE